MGLDDLLSGHDLILKQCNAVKDLPSKCLKEYTPNNSWLERKQLENQLEEKFNFIKADRIERSNNLSQAQWVPHLKKAKVIKRVGKLWETLGHHQDNEDWLLPEEVLFLMENGELQLYCESVSLSIEDCYELLFNGGLCSLDEYRVFSYLSRAGLRVVHHSPSVTVTQYEKQVRLDSVVQQQKRTPPRISNEDDILIIDEDISIIEQSKNTDCNMKTSTNKSQTSKQDIVLIDLEDDKEDIKTIDSDSDSDVVCISSPTYISNQKPVRHWYPVIQKCLMMSSESVIIDLSEEEDKDLVKKAIDLLNVPKAEILSLIPSLIGGLSRYRYPDSRLLPPAIRPKHSDYKVNVNFRRDTEDEEEQQQQQYQHQIMERQSFPLQMNNFGFQGGYMNHPMGFNPMIQRAQEMQAMAMNMIQSAAALMSNAFNPPNHNPNELWEMYGNRNTAYMQFTSRMGFCNQPRRSYPRRRPYRYPRRRPYGRNPWAVRNSYRFDNSRPNFPDVKPSFPLKAIQSSNDTVVLSDDDDNDDDEVEIISTGSSEHIESTNLRKRKVKNDPSLNKRLKTEDVLGGITSKSTDSSCIFESVESGGIKRENKESLPSDSIQREESTINGSVKREFKESDKVVKQEGDESKLAIKSEQDDVERALKHEKISQSDDKKVTELNSTGISSACDKSSDGKQICSNTKLPSENLDESSGNNGAQTMDVTDEQQQAENSIDAEPTINTVGSNCTNSNISNEEEMNISSTSNREPSQPENISSDDPNSAGVINDSNSRSTGDSKNPESCHGATMANVDKPVEIISWEQYKNFPQEDFGENDDALLKFDNCYTYGDVLTSLQIFKDIKVNRIRNKFKISFDVYLPESNFKKSLKVLPNYRVIVVQSSDELPSPFELEGLAYEYQDNIPFLFSIVFSETIAFYLYNTISLNTNCD